MRILLVGEYSRLHNSLKEALVQLGHEVTLVGTGDGFKNFPVDVDIDAKWLKSKVPNLFRQVLYKLFRYDIARIEYGMRFRNELPKLKNYDVVQLISLTPFFAPLWMEFALLKKLRSQNKTMFTLTSGTDAIFMKAAMEGKFRYSLIDPYLADKSIAEEYAYALPHLTTGFKKHHEKMLHLLNGIIATDIDYDIALTGHPKSLGMIPNPVNIETIPFGIPDINEEIVIFHGINRWNYHKKGNAFFEEALEIIEKKYPGRVKIITAENIPYVDYIKLYDASHILLDQVYAYDQGYNALEAMARGKVVFTGAEKEFMAFYGLDEPVAINALPDINDIVSKLSFLIDHPEEISAIGKRAREFVEKEHDYLKVATKYNALWVKK
ncbi:MAG TPA: glycosyltransferase [Flavobacterium sp.]|jgi:glycosyltransferase involved in cell wall biosynthesis